VIPAVRGIVTNWFNRVVFENDLKWGEWEDLGKRARTMAALDWLKGQGLAVRGHTLVWPILGSPAEQYPTPTALRSALNSRVSAVAGHVSLRGRLADWDVVNEATRYGAHVGGFEDLYRSTAFDPALVEFFQRTRLADPTARRVLNEFGILEEAGGNPARKDRLKRHLRTLRAASSDLVQAIGLQAHITDGGLMAPETLRMTLSEFQNEFGLPVVISEADFHIADTALRADYTRDFLTAAFSHPAVSEVMLWIWFANDWHKHAAMFDANWHVLPNGVAWSNLVHREWTTEITTHADKVGEVRFRGFKGVYDIEVDSSLGRIGGRVTPVGGILDVIVPDPPSVIPPLGRPPQRAGHQLRLGFEVFAPGRYVLERTDGFGPPAWKVVQDKMAPAGLIEFLEPIPASGSGFFRLRAAK